MYRILITNDDGINADGIIRLAKVAKKFGEVTIVAPDSQRSAMSHSLTLKRNIKVWQVDFPIDGVKAYACDGNPTDCIRLGIMNICKIKPDIIFSGINYGFNVAGDIQYSATAGAAFEAVFNGIRAIAFSEENKEIHEVTDAYLENIIREYIDRPLNQNEIWNVNFPGCQLNECKGILENRKVSFDPFYADRYIENKIDDITYEYILGSKRNFKGSKGTDLDAIINNYISIGKVKNIS